MTKKFCITEWVEDASLPDQSLWGESFSSLEYASMICEATYKIGLHKYGRHSEGDDNGESFRRGYYVAVQNHWVGVDERGFRREESYDAVGVMTNIGYLGGAAMERFMAKWEG